jgi:hypothetical protein
MWSVGSWLFNDTGYMALNADDYELWMEKNVDGSGHWIL